MQKARMDLPRVLTEVVTCSMHVSLVFSFSNTVALLKVVRPSLLLRRKFDRSLGIQERQPV